MTEKIHAEEKHPFVKFYDLSTLSEGGVEILLAPTAAERAATAQWAELASLDRLTARVTLLRKGANRYLYSAEYEADLAQNCVITLDPVPAKLAGIFEREFRVPDHANARRKRAPVEVDQPVSLDEDEPEMLESHILDLAAPVLEEMVLNLDPYPKAPGAVFAPEPEPADKADNPFAVLQRLKDKG